MKFAISDICSAFSMKTIGTKVVNQDAFLKVVSTAIETHDFSTDRIPGQAFLSCPAVPYISSGVGRRRPDPQDYICREHRGIVSAYLRREFTEPATGCSVVVYTAEAYLRDPDVTPTEAERITNQGATHVLVAVLGHVGPEPPLPPYRLVWNLAGGNREALTWSLGEIRAKAKAAIDYDNAWVAVAD